MSKARIGGILSIVAGGLGVVGSLCLVLFVLYFTIADQYGTRWDTAMPGTGNGGMVALVAMAIVFALIGGILAIIGGISALRRRNWPLALAGSIGACFTPGFVIGLNAIGIAAVVFTTLGRHEFKEAPPASANPPPAT